MFNVLELFKDLIPIISSNSAQAIKRCNPDGPNFA